MRTTLAAIAALAVPFVPACVDGGGAGGPPVDAGLAIDAGTFDASIPIVDGATPGDASPTIDASPVVDASADASVGNEAILVPALGTGFDYYQGSYDLGWTFTVGAPITITSLGFYDDQKNGLTESHPVGVYDRATQALLAQATVAPTDPLVGFFRYTTLAPPLGLEQGHTYVLVALVGSEKYLAFNQLDPAWTVAPPITYTGGAVNYANPKATSLLYPDTFGDAGGDFGPNFFFTSP